MFKKRSRPAGSREKDTPIDEPGPSAHPASRTPPSKSAEAEEEEPEQDLTTEIDELILLRKLRKGKQGIDLARFNRGEKKVSKDDLGSGSGGYGLSANGIKKRNDDDEPE